MPRLRCQPSPSSPERNARAAQSNPEDCGVRCIRSFWRRVNTARAEVACPVRGNSGCLVCGDYGARVAKSRWRRMTVAVISNPTRGALPASMIPAGRTELHKPMWKCGPDGTRRGGSYGRGLERGVSTPAEIRRGHAPLALAKGNQVEQHHEAAAEAARRRHLTANPRPCSSRSTDTEHQGTRPLAAGAAVRGPSRCRGRGPTLDLIERTPARDWGRGCG
jgi:hypothetical protein